MKLKVLFFVCIGLLIQIDAQINTTSGSMSSGSGCGFSVRKVVKEGSAWKIPASPFNMQFRDVVANKCGGWSEQYSEFTAPEDGGYFFTFSAMSSLDDDFTIHLRKNGRTEMVAYGSGDYAMSGNSMILVLYKGDAVNVQLSEGVIYEHMLENEHYTSFSGFKVFDI